MSELIFVERKQVEVVDEYEKYEKKHRYCPECNGTSYISTLMACMMDMNNPEDHKDRNIVQCKCGWEGIVHDLEECKWKTVEIDDITYFEQKLKSTTDEKDKEKITRQLQLLKDAVVIYHEKRLPENKDV